MINKKNLLGKEPIELGIKDAIHTAIVSVRAGRAINPGQRCGLNENREAVPDEKGCGVADPFLRTPIPVGKAFWLLLCQDEVPNVQHVWEHPTVDFTPPAVEAKKNKYLDQYAAQFGVTYEQLMNACAYVVEKETSAPYPGTMTRDQVDEANSDAYDVWYEWANETGHEFYNRGTECCPEYDYPDARLFALPAA